MNQRNLEWKSTSGINIFASVWMPNNSPKAVVCLVHGFGEHCMRYTPYIEYFIKKDIAFVAYDQVGHGESGGKRGVITSYNDLLNDVLLCIDKAKELFPNVPQYLYGHSMGGNIALNFLIKNQPKLQGAIITSPWLTLTNNPSFILRAMVTFLKTIFPNVTIKSGLEIEYISTVNEEVEKYKSDPKNHGKISFRLLNSIVKSGIWAMLNTSKLKVPILLMHGAKDMITSPLSSLIASKGNKEQIKFIEWANAYHELHNEVNREEVANTVLNWIKLEK